MWDQNFIALSYVWYKNKNKRYCNTIYKLFYNEIKNLGLFINEYTANIVVSREPMCLLRPQLIKQYDYKDYLSCC